MEQTSKPFRRSTAETVADARRILAEPPRRRESMDAKQIELYDARVTWAKRVIERGQRDRMADSESVVYSV